MDWKNDSLGQSNLYLKDMFFFKLCMCMCVSVYVCVYKCRYPWRLVVSDPFELELRVVSQLIWQLRI